jgi:hypothetical protein
VRRRWLPAALTVLLHAAVLALLLHTVTVAPRAHAEPPGSPVPVQLLTEGSDTITGTQAHGKPCEKSYVGIGIQHWGESGVFQVAPGGPADRAGMLVGDAILNPEILGRDRHPEGTLLVLSIQRGARTITMPMRTERICEDDR